MYTTRAKGFMGSRSLKFIVFYGFNRRIKHEFHIFFVSWTLIKQQGNATTSFTFRYDRKRFYDYRGNHSQNGCKRKSGFKAASTQQRRNLKMQL